MRAWASPTRTGQENHTREQGAQPARLNRQVTSPATWTAIIPIRSFTTGKTRLQIPAVDTASIIEAFTADVIRACAACPKITRVVVVSPDPEVVTRTRELGCETVTEQSALGINTAIDVVRKQTDGPVIAILGDTPCLTGAVLSMVISKAEQCEVSFVSDASGVGSTMWCAQSGSHARSHFGHHSRAEHRSHGAVELGSGNASSDWARARRDVDTDVDLWDAIRLGIGPASSQLLTVLDRRE